MPAIRRQNITGRRRRRDILRNTQRYTVENVSRQIGSRTGVSQQIPDFYKSALIFHDDCDPYTIGSMTFICNHCSAQHFNLEKTGNNNVFSLCCHKGKVDLPPLLHSPYFESLITGITSSDRAAKKRSLNYLDHIRSYNCAFAMVSSETHLDEKVTGGMYHFKMHDTFYHRIGSLIPSAGVQPKYAQNYFYDVDTAVENRMQEHANVKCDADIMREITVYLKGVNPYVQSFQTMGDLCRNFNGGNDKEMCMHITLDRSSDQRRYNDATSTDVAAIFRCEDGAPPGERNLVVMSKSGGIRSVSVLDPSLDPLAYPLLFPLGDPGWNINILHTDTNRQRHKTTMLQYAAYRLSIRQPFSLLHRSQKLYLQWVVDMYVRIEGTRLSFIRHNQSNLRADMYLNIADYLHQRAVENNLRVGRQVILPSSFIGSPRNMHQNYLDAMSIVQKFGKPSLFLTMTCNPRWPEIRENLETGESSHYRPDIIVRVFHCKLKELLTCITKKQVFGKVAALIYTIEFQKRGLPHAHMLLTLDDQDNIRNVVDIDKVVSAEIPDKNTHPKLYEKEGSAKKNFPKDFNETTDANVNGYAVYKRRDDNRTVQVRGQTVDNRFIVPYNPYLLAKFDCHINVEVCSTVQSIKYIYKYVYKGYDCATLQFSRKSEGMVVYDEIDSFLNGRYVGSTEAAWRIFEYEMHYQSHTIIRLECHLPFQQTVYFREGNEEQAAFSPKVTKLEAFFTLNQQDPSANNLLYVEIPQHYTWQDQQKKWKTRLRGADKTITRLYTVNPKNVELFHLRLLLLHVRGPKSFEDLRLYDGVVFHTFFEAAYARGIASNDEEWRDCLTEAKDLQHPKQLRQLFGIICGINVPPNALALWNDFKSFLCEDFLRSNNEVTSFNRCLLEIEEILVTHNTSCESLGLPVPTSFQQYSNNEHLFDPLEQGSLFEQMYSVANEEQRYVIDAVLGAVLCDDAEESIEKVFCLTAHAGCGKTFVQKAILCKLRSMQLDCVPCAFSGIAASLLEGGRTLHNVFKLPIPLLENSVSGITVNSRQAVRLLQSSLIIIDEVSMCPLYAIKVIDRLLRDICSNGEKKKLFGGKTVLLCGDFQQTLPVVPHSSRSGIIENCVKSWPFWTQIKKLTLTQNMRALPSELEFIEFLKDIGNGKSGDLIEIPSLLIGTGSIIYEIYGNIPEIVQTSEITNRAILAPKNEDCEEINCTILGMLPSEKKTYFSIDSVVTDDEHETTLYPTEFLNSLSISGLPPHKLTLKENAIVLLIRNLNTSKALINGTRMRVKRLHRNSLDCEVLTGASRGERILIPRINLRSSGTLLPFILNRVQFPVILAFAMTINKSQGQSISRVGIYLPQPVFAHGQLYVAASRAQSFNGLKFYISDTDEQGHLKNDNRVFTKNIVYKELL